MVMQTGSGETHAEWTLDRGWLVARKRLTDYDYVQFDAEGAVVHRTTGWNAPTDAHVAAWAAEAPRVWTELNRQRDERRAATEAAKLPSVKARYPGTCAVTGRDYPAGTHIAKRREGWAIADAATGAEAAARAAAPIRISRGEGYGGRPYRVGETLRARWHEGGRQHEGVVTVVSAGATFYRGGDEIAMSMGVGDDEGHLYTAWCRPATDEEAAPVLAAEAAAERRRQAIAALDAALESAEAEVPAEPRPAGDRYDFSDAWPFRAGWVAVEPGGCVWHVQYNGADGDDWSRNTLPGAIALRLPATAERTAAVAEAAATGVLIAAPRPEEA